MRLYEPVHFSVPFEDNSAAKALGARFDWETRTWYAPDQQAAARMAARWDGRGGRGKGDAIRVLYFDTETNGVGGFRPPTQRLVQIAWEFDGAEGNALIDDVEEINPAVPHPHSVETCRREGVPFDEAVAPFMAALRACDHAVAHNLDFDRGVIAFELRRRGADPREFEALMAAKGYCTMKNTVQICQLPSTTGRGYKWPRLEELFKHLTGSAPTLALHDAMNDVTVMRTCVALLAERGLAGFVQESAVPL